MKLKKKNKTKKKKKNKIFFLTKQQKQEKDKTKTKTKKKKKLKLFFCQSKSLLRQNGPRESVAAVWHNSLQALFAVERVRRTGVGFYGQRASADRNVVQGIRRVHLDVVALWTDANPDFLGSVLALQLNESVAGTVSDKIGERRVQFQIANGTALAKIERGALNVSGADRSVARVCRQPFVGRNGQMIGIDGRGIHREVRVATDAQRQILRPGVADAVADVQSVFLQ